MTAEGPDRSSPFVPPSVRLDLAAAAREVLEKVATAPSGVVDATAVPDLWTRIGGLGWTGIVVPERYGGLGLGFADLCAVLEEAGRVLLGAPLADSAVCSMAIARFAPHRAEELLPAMAEGRLVGTVAFDSTGSLRSGPEHLLLSGHALFVGHASQADVVCVLAPGGAEPSLILLEGDLLGAVSRGDTVVTDPSRQLGRLDFDGALPPEALVARGPEAIRAALWLRALGAIALAADCVGGADRALELATSYAIERHQFGRPIGSFQAIKHKLADMLAAVEHGRTAMRAAASSIDEDHPEAVMRAAIAKAYCGDGFVRVAEDNLQVHGGLGFTWEDPAHRYYKRAVVNSQLVWSTAACREHIRASLFS